VRDVARGGAKVGCSPLPKSTRPGLAGPDSSFVIPFYSNPDLIDRFSRAIREPRQLTWLKCASVDGLLAAWSSALFDSFSPSFDRVQPFV
jgi:hypothetical protein